MLRQGGRPRARAHASPAWASTTSSRRSSASRPASAARARSSSIARSETWARRGGARGAPARRRRAGLPASTSATCARWSPSSRASWPARRSSRPTCSARRAPSRARSPPAVPRVHTGVEVQAIEVARGAVTGVRTSAGVLPCARGGHRRRARGAARSPRRPGVALPLEPRKGQLVRLRRRAPRRAPHPPQGRRGRLPGLGGERRRGPAGHHGARDDVGGRRARGLQPRAPRLRPRRRRRGERRHARAGLRAHARPARAARSTRRGPGCARGCPIAFPPSGRRGAVAGLWLATGHEGAGVALGPVTGRLVAQLYAGEAPIVDPAPFSPDRF